DSPAPAKPGCASPESVPVPPNRSPVMLPTDAPAFALNADPSVADCAVVAAGPSELPGPASGPAPGGSNAPPPGAAGPCDIGPWAFGPGAGAPCAGSGEACGRTESPGPC